MFSPPKKAEILVRSAQPPPATMTFREPFFHDIVASASPSPQDPEEGAGPGTGVGTGVGRGVGRGVGWGEGSGVGAVQSGVVGV